MSIQKAVKRVQEILTGNASTPEQPQQPQQPSGTVGDKQSPETHVARAVPDLSCLVKAGPKVVVPPVAAVHVIAAPAPVVVAAPVKSVETTTVKTETPVPALILTKAEIEQIVLQYLREHSQVQSAETPAIVQPTEAEPGLHEGEIAGTRVPLYVEKSTLIVNTETGASITREEFERRESEQMSRAIADRSRVPRSPQVAITHGPITGGKHEYRRR
jgi:hypothetical protein